jgi:hypothetical protein
VPRPRLTPEEREARRKARSAFSFSRAAYEHYDPRKEGYGSAEEWMAAAEALAGGRGTLRLKPKTGVAADLALLFLDDLPADIAGLKKAYRNTLFLVHPDYGGDVEKCKAVVAAFERLTKFY